MREDLEPHRSSGLRLQETRRQQARECALRLLRPQTDHRPNHRAPTSGDSCTSVFTSLPFFRRAPTPRRCSPVPGSPTHSRPCVGLLHALLICTRVSATSRPRPCLKYATVAYTISVVEPLGLHLVEPLVSLFSVSFRRSLREYAAAFVIQSRPLHSGNFPIWSRLLLLLRAVCT